MTPICVADYRELARRRLPPLLFHYIDGGADAEASLARNVADFADLSLRQRVLRDVSHLSTATELFGQSLSAPIVLGPVGLAGMFARRGEAQAARAAKAAGAPFCLSTVGVCALDEVTAAAGAPPWFQLYMIKDRGFMRSLLERASQIGAPVLVFTVDVPAPGLRRRDFRTGMAGELTARSRLDRAWQGLSHPLWLWNVYMRGKPHDLGNLRDAVVVRDGERGPPDIQAWIRNNFDPSVTWADLDWIRRHWPGPIVLKGILDPQDARAAVDAGADGIVVSNHGGRQLDGVASSISALPSVVAAVGGAIPVLVDSGVRSGSDVLKALALGADAVLLGRAWAWALAAGGEAGVADMLAMLRRELETAMTLAGCTDIRAAGPELLWRPSQV